MPRWAALLAVLLLVAELSAAPSVLAAPQSDPPTGAAKADPPLTVTIVSIDPPAPDARQLAQKLTVTVRVTNTGTRPISNLSVELERGQPIVREDQLQQAIAGGPLASDPMGIQYVPAVPIRGTLEPGDGVTARIVTMPGSDTGGLCLCNMGIYPVDAVAIGSTGGDQVEGTSRTFMPSFPDPDLQPEPVRVSWVWPLLDRPHRGISPSVFTDDDLASSVAPGGRLDRALAAVGAVRPGVGLTLVVDPELIDALQQMVDGYTVTTNGKSSRGNGGAAAKAWLDRLHTVAEEHDIALTGYADPDVDAITAAGQTWSATLDPQVAARVAAVVGTTTVPVYWPVNELLTDHGLDSVVANGAAQVILRDTALQRGRGQLITPDALAPLPSLGGGAQALVTSAALEKTVTAALRTRSATTAATARVQLLAQLAVRAAGEPTRPHYVVLTPPRAVDVDPALAAQLINASVGQSWSESITVGEAAHGVTPVDHGSLRPGLDGNAAAQARLRSVATIAASIDSFRDCLTNDDAAALLGGYAAAVQRAQSSAWRQDAKAATAYIKVISGSIQSLRNSVRLVQPQNAQYTLSSSDAPLYITVSNALTRPVRIRIRITPSGGAQGFSTESVGVQEIPAGTSDTPTRVTIKIPAHVERSGRFRITVQLETPSGQALGKAVPLRVHSTALGAVALWITGTAFAVLLIALTIRVGRRIQRARRAKRRVRPVTAAGAT
jgi:hypothetical protein